MADTILSSDFTVYYLTETRQKRIVWTGTLTGTRTVNELYSALQDLFDELDQMDDGIPISAQTPSEYTIGSIDAGDRDPWFIDPITIQHLKGGSIQTTGWTRDVTTRTGSRGIVKVTRSGATSNIVSEDIGYTIANGTNDGTLLYVTGTELWIRPTVSASDDDWTSGSGNITCNGHTDTWGSGATTGEREWANIYTIGSITANSTLYIYQNMSKLTNFWGKGHLDRLFLINDGFSNGLIDYGLLTIFNREYTSLYDHYVADVSAGGRNPIPLATSGDINNKTGIFQTVFSGTSGGTWTKGHTFTKNSDSTREGTVTKVIGTNPNVTIQYYLSSTELTPFSDGDAVTSSGSATGTIVTPIYIGSGLLTGVTVTFGHILKDIGDQAGDQAYDVSIVCNNYHLNEIYEYLKYITRRGSTADIDNGSQTIIGEQYPTPGEVRLYYENQTVNFLEGATVTGQTSTATGIITANHDNGATGQIIIRAVRGTFQDGEQILDSQGTPGNAYIIASNGVEATLVSKVAPFGTFGGSTFFGARGVWIEGMHSDDANNYQLVDAYDQPRIPPLTVNLIINIVDNDGVVITDSCEVTIVKTSDSSELYNAENVTTGTTTYNCTSTAGTITYINVMNVTGYQAKTVNNYTLPSSTTTLNVQLDEDRFYSNPA